MDSTERRDVNEEQTGHIAVIGAGSIGVGWATVFSRSGQRVVVYDVDAGRLDDARREFERVVSRLHAAELLENVKDALGGVTFTSDLATAVGSARFIQECIPESLELKKQLFATLESLAPSDAVFASSSSAITCSSFAAVLESRSRCIVAHPANPPYLLPVVELVPAPFTSPQTLAATRTLMAGAGLTVIAVKKEIEGFVYNRLQGALLREAYCLVRDGVAEPEDIDRIVRDGLGRRWSVIGPFETADLNTRGGIESHAAKLGPAYARMGAERGQHDEWSPELVARVAESVHRRLPLDEWVQNCEKRDLALMALEHVRRESPEIFSLEKSPSRSD
jgi:3-hydroxyacyl-CoA dehydrogenase